MNFTLLKSDPSSKARLGRLETAHGTLDTPFFMPVGTRGAVKALLNEQLLSLDVPMIASNAYPPHAAPRHPPHCQSGRTPCLHELASSKGEITWTCASVPQNL
ncbi:MAG: tRNA-guanine transglycosylase [Parachlamydia sp.]|nr:tRNA-guanine transglycosylase [Parachlamydia sp.]